MALRPKQGLALQYPQKIRKSLDPVGGQWAILPPSKMPFNASPDMLNCVVRNNHLEKRPGYSQWSPGNAAIGTRVVGIYATYDDQGNSYLYAGHPTGVVKYNTGTNVWDTVTGTALTGGSEKLFRWVVSQNSLLFANGVDPVKRIPFDLTYASLNANCPAARYIERFADRVYIAHTVEAASQKPFRIRRSVVNDHTDWVGIGSGFNELTEAPYFIKNIKRLGTELAIYTEKGIYAGVRTGIAAAPMQIEPRATDVGLFSPLVLEGYKELHFLMGSDDFYLYNGYKPESIGENIRDAIFTSIDLDHTHMNSSAVLQDSQEFLAFLCMGGSSTPNMAWVYNWALKVWYPWSVAGPLCSTVYKSSDYVSIDELVGTIDEQVLEIDASPFQSGYPTLLTGHTDGKIYMWSTGTYGDNGQVIPCRWTSKDIVSEDLDPSKEGMKISLTALHCSYKSRGSASLNFFFSTDGGVTWDGPYAMNLAAAPAGGQLTASVWRQVTGDRIRFKFEHSANDETFRIASFRLEMEIKGAPVYS